MACEKGFWDSISYLGGLMGFGWFMGVTLSRLRQSILVWLARRKVKEALKKHERNS